MRNLIYSLVIFTALFFMGGCEKSIMDFEGEDAIYFDVRRGSAWVDSSKWSRYYHTEVNFIKIDGDTTEVVMELAVAGKVTDYPRPFRVEVVKDSSTAVEGRDFDFQREWVVPAGASRVPVRMQVYRQDDLLDTNRTIVLRVVDNEYFKTNLSFKGELGGRTNLSEEEKVFNPDPRFHTVNLKLMVAKPTSWSGVDYPKTETNPTPYERGSWGAFTVKKYMLILELSGFTDDYFNQYVPDPIVDLIREKMVNYLEEQFDKGEPVLETDKRLMWVNGVKWYSYQYEW